MPRRLAFLTVLAGMATATSLANARQRDAICNQLRSFEAAPFARGADGKPAARSVAFFWSGDWLIGGSLGCRRKKTDSASVDFCSYLGMNTNQEFRGQLPIRILTCFGYRFPRGAFSEWGPWVAEIRDLGRQGDRSVTLKIDLNRPDSADGEVQIWSLPVGVYADDAPREAPPSK
jgi:hypothetical protein